VDRETGPEPTTSGPAEPDDTAPNIPVPSRAIVAGLAADPRVPIWIRRAIIAVIVALAFTLWKGWRVGLTAAAIVAIIDTVYQSKTIALIPAAARVSSAQRRTRRRLYSLRPFGYMALHTRGIPGSDSIIDHLVIGPGGVYAVDSERWDRRLPVRTITGGAGTPPMLYHGPYSQKDRLAHARWEAAQAARLLSEDLGEEITVQPVMVIYGPTVPWVVTNLRGVDVFAGRRVGKYFRTRKRSKQSGTLGWQEASDVYTAAERVLPKD
jgi:Nuclease-related domain